jgi:hypothetical protein
MPEFRGPKNLHVGDWAKSEWDATGREYVITLDAAGAKKFRALPDEHKYGFREIKSAEKADDSED